MRAGAVVFDVDGVLLDTRSSFTACVLRTAHQEAGVGPEWGETEVEALRLAGGFNNDWDLTAALALLAPLSEPGGAWARLCGDLALRGGGPCAVAARVGDGAWRSMRERVEGPFQRLYAGRRAREIYGVAPGEGDGLYGLERPLVPEGFFERLGLPFGLFTGRDAGEWTLASERLGLSLPVDRVVFDAGPRWRKPNPDGLLRLAEVLGTRALVYVGDTVDDQEAAERAAREGLEVAFAGLAPAGSERARRFAARGAAAVEQDTVTALEAMGLWRDGPCAG